MKHYHLALRWVARNMSNPSKRHHLGTAASLLLLAYFDMWMADLDKCRSHLTGLSVLFNEAAEMHTLYPLEQRFFDDPEINISSRVGGISNIHSSPRSPNKEYEQLRELHRSMVKMDVYQSFLGSTPTLLDPKTHTQYPPRAPSPMGSLSTIHGTHDKLMLLMERVGFWIESRRTRIRAGLPWIRDSEEGRRHLVSRGSWESLQEDFQTFKVGLGSWFEPLEKDCSATTESPFGPSLQFRTYSVAGIWLQYYMGLINLHRSDPSLQLELDPAGMVAGRTENFVHQIGQISAGILEDSESSPTTCSNPAQGAAMIESCLPLFTAAAQVSSDVLPGDR